MTFLINTLLAVLLPLGLCTIGNLSTRGTRRLALILARLIGCLYRPGVRLIKANLQTAYPEKTDAEIREMVRKNLWHTVWNYLDCVRLLKHPELAAGMVSEKEVELSSIPLSDQVIACISHLGNWELEAVLAPLYFKKIAAIANKYSKLPRLNSLLEKSRQIHGLQIIYREGAARNVLKAIHSGSSIAILMDQNLAIRHGGVYVDFYELPIPVTPLPSILVQRTKLPVYITACIRKDDGSYRLIIRHVDMGDETDKVRLLQRIMKANEELIRQYPEQYTWLYRRWNDIPPASLDSMLEQSKRYPFYARNKLRDVARQLHHGEH